MSEDESSAKPVRKRPLRVLFIEDNPADVELCLHELKKAGLEVRADVVETPEQFAERLREKSYDIILADYLLYDWTGMDAFDLLRKQGHDLPFLLLTGALGEEKAVECIQKGISDYILKDRLARLPAAICRALEEKYVRDERRRVEALLGQSETMFRTLTETIASAIFIHQGIQCRYANRAAEEITGRKQAEEEIWHLVASDPLTGLANYRRLLDVFDAETQRSGRTGRCFALLLLDLNGLKKINDSHGHLVGSRALCRLAHVLRLQCRVVDTAARHGGDEFAIILPETDADGARNLALRVAERLAHDGEQPPLSFSFGVAVFPRDAKTIDELLGAADHALYEMKRVGANELARPA